jgi:hypothetical protein
MYYVLARDNLYGNVSIMGEHEEEDEAVEHEQQLCNAYSAFHIWTTSSLEE